MRSDWINDPANFEKLRQNFTTSICIHGPNMNLPDMSEALCELRRQRDEAVLAIVRYVDAIEKLTVPTDVEGYRFAREELKRIALKET